jgi:hypothetical protein
MKQMKKYLFRLVAFLGLTITPFIASAEEVSLGESISKFLNDTGFARLVEGSLRNGCYGLSYGSTGYDHDLFNALFFKQLWHLTQRTLALNGYRLAPVKAARADIEYRLKCAVISFF